MVERYSVERCEDHGQGSWCVVDFEQPRLVDDRQVFKVVSFHRNERMADRACNALNDECATRGV